MCGCCVRTVMREVRTLTNALAPNPGAQSHTALALALARELAPVGPPRPATTAGLLLERTGAKEARVRTECAADARQPIHG